MTKWKKALRLRCGSCGRNLAVYVVKRRKDDELIINKGKVKQIGNKTRLSVRCNRCHVRTVFETRLPIVEKDGWKQVYVTPKPKRKPKLSKPTYLRPALYEVDKTYAMVDAHRRRKR